MKSLVGIIYFEFALNGVNADKLFCNIFICE